MAASSAVPEYRLRLPYVPRAIFKSYHARQRRWAVIVAQRRAGKTVATINDLVKTTLLSRLPHPRGWYISPTFALDLPQGTGTGLPRDRGFCDLVPGAAVAVISADSMAAFMRPPGRGISQS